MTRILFPDPFIITQVSAVRALGRRGDVCEIAWPYGALKKRFRSRFVGKVYATADLATEPDQFAQDVVDLCRNHEFDFVLPVSIESTDALIPYQSDLEQHVATLLPTAEQLQIGADKSKTVEFCEQFDIAHPETWTLRNSEEVDCMAKQADYPIVLKHTRNFGGSRGVRFVGHARELSEAFENLRSLSTFESPILVQEYIPGLLFDAVTVAKDGFCPQLFTSVRKLMYPVSGGVTCISVSTRSPELKAIAAKVVAALNWNGPLEMEFKLDSRDGKFKLIEINPRFWASLDSAVQCGVNFPAIAVDLALGRDPELYPEYEVGVRHKFLIGRVPYAYWQLMRVNGLGAIRDPQQYSRTTNDIDLRDPMPDLFKFLMLTRDLLKGKLPKRLSAGAKKMILPLDTEVPYA